MNPFSLVLGLSAALGLAWVARQAPAGQELPRIDASLWGLLGGLAGGRAAYVALNWEYFRFHPAQIPAFYLGGLAWPGAICGGLLALGLASALTRKPFGLLVDFLLPLLVSLSMGAWLGCWLAGCAYGSLTTAPWGVPASDEWGIIARRWPAQLLGALLTLGWFWLLEWARRRWTRFARPGRAAALWLLGLAFELLGLAYLRADPLPAWRGLHLDGWAALGLAVLASTALLLGLLPLHSSVDRLPDRQTSTPEG